MKLQDYIQHLTTLMELHQAQEFEVKTRYVSIDHWGHYGGDRVEDASPDQFVIDKEIGVAFVDCDSTELQPVDEILSEYKEQLIQDAEC